MSDRFHHQVIPSLALELLAKASAHREERLTLEPNALSLLCALPWHGGRVEFETVMAQLGAAPGPVIGVREVLAAISCEDGGDAGPMTLRAATRRFERMFIQSALDAHDGVIQRAAAALGMHPPNLHRKLRALGIGRTKSEIKTRKSNC